MLAVEHKQLNPGKKGQKQLTKRQVNNNQASSYNHYGEEQTSV
jgi:hypothetical protein